MNPLPLGGIASPPADAAGRKGDIPGKEVSHDSTRASKAPPGDPFGGAFPFRCEAAPDCDSFELPIGRRPPALEPP